MTIPRLVLGSTSPTRKKLLQQLGVTFEQCAPHTDETPRQGEQPADLVHRLGLEKARSAGRMQASTSTWICIGSDQVCHLAGEQFGKPVDSTGATAQLTRFSGNWVTFSTSLALVTSEGREYTAVEDFECRFRVLNPAQIARYLTLDQPYDCAGSIRVENAGIALLQDIRGRDINALYGLPLMLLTEGLAALGHDIFDFNK